MNDTRTVTLIEVYTVTATYSPNTFMVNCKFADGNGNEAVVNHTYNTNDPYGISPQIKVWMEENNPTILPYVPPTAEEIRATLPPLSRRQFRLGMKKLGITKETIENLIANIPDNDEREIAEIEWEDATTFERNNPLVITLSTTLNVDPIVIDTEWNEALAY